MIYMVKVSNSNESTKSKCIYTYRFLTSYKNPSWSIEKLVPLRSCLIHNNSEKILFGDFISRVPKYNTILTVEKNDLCAGKIDNYEYCTDDFKAFFNRRRKAIDKFSDFYEPLYRKRKVTLLFHTLTRIDYARQDISALLDIVKYRYRALKRPIRGYFWVMEISVNDHWHYHLVVAIDRVRWKEIPEELKFEELWGQRTDIGFVRKSVRNYLNKELGKCSAKIIGNPVRRMYGTSSKYI